MGDAETCKDSSRMHLWGHTHTHENLHWLLYIKENVESNMVSDWFDAVSDHAN
jgi:hypothetical protein